MNKIMDKIIDLKYKKKILKEKYKEKLRNRDREYVFKQIRKYKGKDTIFQIDKPDLLFEINEISGEKKIDIPEDIKYRIDYSNVFFDDVNISKYDFSGMKNVCINPQTVFNKDMRGCILDNVCITGSFDDVYITRTNFTNSIGALVNPQTIYDKDARGTIFTDALVIDNFDGVKESNTVYDGMIIMTEENLESLSSLKKYLKDEKEKIKYKF